MKIPGWQNLQTRYATIGIVFSIALIGVAWFGHQIVTNINTAEIENLNSREQVIGLLDQLEKNIHALQQESQQFLINPDSGNKFDLDNRSDDILIGLENLSNTNWIQQTPERVQIIADLGSQHQSVMKEINRLLLIRGDVEKWFPASSVMIEKITPASEQFYISATTALENIQSLEHSPTQYRINKLFSDMLSIWSRMISTYRLQVMNRFSIFGNAEPSMEVHEYNIALYLDDINDKIYQLSELDKQGELDFEASIALENIKRSRTQWQQGYEEARQILHSGAWRKDISILKNNVTPAFNDVYRSLEKIKDELVKSSTNEIKMISDLAGNLSYSLFMIAISALLVMGLGFMILRRYVLKPISDITSALYSFAAGEKSTLVADTNLQEIDSLISAFSEMKRQIRIRQSELELSRDQANEANKIKGRFLARMSHELRTPLNAIIGFSELALSQMKQEPNSPYIDDIQDINQAGRHLLAIVNDILDFSRAEAGTMGVTLGEIEVSALIENIRETSQTYLAHTDNSMEILIPDDVGPIYSDTDKIRCILLNIINNACKYTHNGKITLQVSKDKIENEDYVIFTITDTGIGMDHEDMSRMFDAFVQGDDSFSRKYEGIGLGLALSLKYIHLLGGVMCVESEPGDGSRFAVYLPEITSVDPNTTAQESTTPEFI